MKRLCLKILKLIVLSISFLFLFDSINLTTKAFTFTKIIDSSNYKFGYAYAPSIVYEDNKYHMFFCSNGDNGAWDFIRYSESIDGSDWTAPKVVLQATNTVHKDKVGKYFKDIAACDPSVVFFEGYYYMFYSSAYETGTKAYQTVIQVSRSEKIQGPYAALTDRGTWDFTPSDPKIIIYPKIKRSSNTGYGAGQQTIISRNGKIMMWYVDDSIDPKKGTNIYFLESADPAVWDSKNAVETNLRNVSPPFSPDVKFDQNRNKFIILGLGDQHSSGSYLRFTYSDDGITWQDYGDLISSEGFPSYAHNVGISGDIYGNLLNVSNIVAFGVPYDLAIKDIIGKWDLFGVKLDINTLNSCNVKGYKIDENGIPCYGKNCPLNISVKIDTAATKKNPYSYNSLLYGSYSVDISNPEIYKVSNVICENCEDKFKFDKSSYKEGTRVSLQCLPNQSITLNWSLKKESNLICDNSIVGDLDCDNNINLNDLNELNRLYYKSLNSKVFLTSKADINGDGKLNLVDIDIWKELYRKSLIN